MAKKKIAVVTDFDWTLARGNIPSIVIEHNIDAVRQLYPNIKTGEDYWSELDRFRAELGIESKVTAYVEDFALMANRGILPPLTPELLRQYGTESVLFPGLPEFYGILRQDFAEHADLSFHVISSGLEDMIKGTAIASEIGEANIHGSRFVQDKDGIFRISNAVEKERKIKYLVQISKGLEDEDAHLAKHAVGYNNIIWLTDSRSDTPATAFLLDKGGAVIGVYDPQDPSKKERTIKELKSRVGVILPADYRKGSPLYQSISGEIMKRLEKPFDPKQERLFE